MIKKTFVALLIAVILGIGVLSVVNTTYAQDIPEEFIVDEYIPQPLEAAYTYEYQLQVGEQNGEVEPVMTRTRTQSHMGEYGEGECDGEPIQLRLQEHKSNMQLRQGNRQMQDGSCTGECTPLRKGSQGN